MVGRKKKISTKTKKVPFPKVFFSLFSEPRPDGARLEGRLVEHLDELDGRGDVKLLLVQAEGRGRGEGSRVFLQVVVVGKPTEKKKAQFFPILCKMSLFCPGQHFESWLAS